MASQSLPLFPGPVLGIETSCDETSVAVLDGLMVLSNVVSSQAELHKQWGGVVPEAASRAHVEAMLPTLERALEEAGEALGGSPHRGEAANAIELGGGRGSPNHSLTSGRKGMLEAITGIAVTNRPGLIGALSVGVTAAKALAFAKGLPLIGVHHLEGHLLSPIFTEADLEFPHVCLLVSGGHTELILVKEVGQYELIGQTRDDAAGEAFDKSARLLGLGYPGGMAIQVAAETGDPARYPLPKGLSAEETFDFSFSGLKTAVLRMVQKEGAKLSVPDAAASIQEAITSVLSERALAAALAYGVSALTLAGGVAANRRLRDRLAEGCRREGVRLVAAPLEFCTDNGAMIALAGSMKLAADQRDSWDLEPMANAPVSG